MQNVGSDMPANSVFVCIRCADMPDTPVPSYKRHCAECDRWVWVDKRTAHVADRAGQILCLQCSAPFLEGEHDLRIHPDQVPIIREALEDIKRAGL